MVRCDCTGLSFEILQEKCPDLQNEAKVVIVGDDGVGKTSLLATYANKPYTENYIPAVFDERFINPVTVDGKTVNLYILDT
ncbi:MAG: hypothetical protein EZS28_044746, partial [Streblomastix strix]